VLSREKIKNLADGFYEQKGRLRHGQRLKRPFRRVLLLATELESDVKELRGVLADDFFLLSLGERRWGWGQA
jgi:hypothetical protein